MSRSLATLRQAVPSFDALSFSRLRMCLVGALATLALGACEDEKKEPETAPAPAVAIDAQAEPESPFAGKTPKDIEFAPTTAGLTELMDALRTAIQSQDEPTIGLLVASLRLEEHEAWMTKTFGADLGKALSEQYKPQYEEIGSLVDVLREQYGNGLLEVDAERFQTKDNSSATGYQSAALGKMVSKVPLYSVRLVTSDRKKTFHIWSFVHEDGSFRFVGKLAKVATKRPMGGRDLNEYRISAAEAMSSKGK